MCVLIPLTFNTTIMKLIAKSFVTRLWMLFLVAGLSMVMVSSLSFAARLKSGDKYGGGKIVWIDPLGIHGLIVAEADLPGGAVYTWKRAIEASKQPKSRNVLINGVLSFWRLPDKDELNQLYKSKSAVGGFADGPEDHYWSSDEYENPASAFGQYFGPDKPELKSGSWGPYSKTNELRVRAVRSF